MDFNDALDLFTCTLATERARPDVHATMLNLADPDTITTVSTQIQHALNGLDTEAYLRDVLGRIADHPINRIDQLLPWNIGAQPIEQPAHRRAA